MVNGTLIKEGLLAAFVLSGLFILIPGIVLYSCWMFVMPMGLVQQVLMMISLFILYWVIITIEIVIIDAL